MRFLIYSINYFNFFLFNYIMSFEQTEGSKAQVWHGTARRTSGGLTKNALMKNKHGRIVSKKQYKRGKQAIKNLFKLGFKPKKGTFKAFNKGRKGSKKMRGGMYALSPSPISGIKGTSGVNLQFVAGNATS
jgi:hypothetical protein